MYCGSGRAFTEEGREERRMADEHTPTAKPEIFVSSKALQMAEAWVRNMAGEGHSGAEVDDSPAVEIEARPARLGLGAKYLPHSQVAATLSPVERKLRAMTNASGKQQEGTGRMGNQRVGALSKVAPEESKSNSESEDEEELKGSSRITYGRPQRRFVAADLLVKSLGSKSKKRKMPV